MAALIPAIIDFVVDRLRRRRGGGGGGGAPAAPSAPPDPTARWQKMMEEYMAKQALYSLDNVNDMMKRATPDVSDESRGGSNPRLSPVVPGMFAPRK